MSDIFVSYARSTALQAQAVAERLRALGYSVWRDDELPAHRPYAEVIEERLRGAKAVVVIWSVEAAKSQWVRAEADLAREAGSLVQLRVDGAALPLPFNQIECADLAGWDGQQDAPGWRKVVASVSSLLQGYPAEGATPAAARTSKSISICVLPFANMSADPEQEFFSDGISEDIITDLSKVSALSVASRNSAFQFKGRHVDVRQIARQLDVTHVLEGSVRKAGERVRITAQLIDAAGDSHVWAERWDRDLTDIFALQDEISQAIVSALKVKLLPEEKTAIRQRLTSNPDAYTLYLMARARWVSGNNDVAGHETIVRQCSRAVALDPLFAQAWVLMALSRTTLQFRYGQSAHNGLPDAERALALDPTLAEPHAVKARWLAQQGRREEALAELATALRLGPDSFEVQSTAGQLAFSQRRLAEAIVHFEHAAALEPTSLNVGEMLICCYQATSDDDGMRRAARMTVERAEAALVLDGVNGQALSAGAAGYAGLGERDKAREWIGRALRIDPDNRAMRYNLACSLSAQLDDVHGAVELLTPYFATASASEVQHAAVDPDLDPLRADPGFIAVFSAAKERTGAAIDEA